MYKLSLPSFQNSLSVFDWFTYKIYDFVEIGLLKAQFLDCIENKKIK